jgi:hypothetical protein
VERKRRRVAAESAVIAVSWFLILGLPAALLLDRGARWRGLLGSAFLLGAGIVALILLAMSVLGIAWTLVSVTIACSLAALALGPPASRRLGRRRPAAAGSETLPAQPARTPAVHLIDAITLLLIVAHGIFATIASAGPWDFWAIWGLKGRVFFEHGGIDWAFLDQPLHAFAHPDYPFLLPLDYAFLALHHGAWNDRWLGILTTLFAAALLLILRDALEEELPPALAALATLGLACIPLSTQWIGMAEAPMIAFGTAALLLLRRRAYALGSVLLGFAAMTKNEGLALVVAAAIAMALSSRGRETLRLWPAVAIFAPGLTLRAIHAVPTDLASGAMTERASTHLADVFRMLLSTPPNRPLLWIAILATLACSVRGVRRERFLFVAVLVQALFFLGAYAVTPNDLAWHIANSWPRLLDQLVVPLGYLALVLAGHFLAVKVEICGQ